MSAQSHSARLDSDQEHMPGHRFQSRLIFGCYWGQSLTWRKNLLDAAEDIFCILRSSLSYKELLGALLQNDEFQLSLILSSSAWRSVYFIYILKYCSMIYRFIIFFAYLLHQFIYCFSMYPKKNCRKTFLL